MPDPLIVPIMMPDSTFRTVSIRRLLKLSFMVAGLLLTGSRASSQTTYSQENFSTLFNTEESAPVNTSFTGAIGTWTAVSTDANSTIAVKTEVSSTDLKFIMNANTTGDVSQNTATSPVIDMSWITCTSKLDFFFQLYTSNVTSGDNGTLMQLQFYNGSSWTTVWTVTAAQLFSTYGPGVWTEIGLMIPGTYMGQSDFRYRFITQKSAGNLTATTLYTDNVRIVNYPCPATASVGDRVWNDVNTNGVQDAGENGISGITVKLAKAPGDTLTSTTDASGLFMFTSLPPAGYKLVFPLVSGMNVTTANTADDATDSDITSGDLSVTVFLTDGENNTSIDAGFFSIILPVELASFQGYLTRQKVELRWVVETNETADRFYVEKSKNGIEFTQAGLVLGSDIAGTASYTFTDGETVNGKVFYRLKAVDKNNKASYSRILVFSSTVVIAEEVKLIGNPVQDKITFSYTSGRAASTVVKIYDISGRTRFSQVLNSSAGANLASLPLPASAENGIYILELTTGNEKLTTRFIKQ